jgi:hypothetical protein
MDKRCLGYFIQHNGRAPLPGIHLPMSFSTDGGVITWDPLYSGAMLYDYAVSGAVRSNKMTYRYLVAIYGPSPDVFRYDIHAFLADIKYINASTGSNTL